jgi:asparagine synthase (glutamine-hydrolysing)
MCGITGIISITNKLSDADALIAMTDIISHRGPDGEGFLLTNSEEQCFNIKSQRPAAHIVSFNHPQNLALGHRRLSILDLNTSASQPMTEYSGRYWIVFNGEIYNHEALRKLLESKGYEFLTDHSDTEVILNAYAEWGTDCLEHFNGMWAFCIWDTVENTFFMARDRAGKKPFYYSEYNGRFYFGSELKSILVNKEIPRELDERAVYDFLTYMMVPAPQTIFKGIHKLPAGHYMLLKLGQAYQPMRYWSPLSNEHNLRITEKEAIEGIKERIYEAARLRMLADVEVGVLLSGGLDSSINLACLTQYANKPIKAFSVGFENGKGYKNEFEFSRKVAKHFGAEYHELTLSEKDFFDFYPEMVYYQDEPIADTANIPIHYIAKTAGEQGVKVLLGGEGSDELFVGYELWRIARQFSAIMDGKPILARAAAFLHRNSPVKGKRIYYHNWYDKIVNGEPSFWSGTELRSEKEKVAMLSQGFKLRLGNYSSFERMSQLFGEYKNKGNLDPYNWMTAVDLQYRLPDLLLARLDRMLMAASVEGRNPFLDVSVMEYAMKLPPSLKTKNGHEKYILKKAFEGILPDEIIYRKKDSFTVPLSNLFNTKDYKDRSIRAIEKFNIKTDIFSNDFINGLSKTNNSSEIWNISNLAMWYNQFNS